MKIALIFFLFIILIPAVQAQQLVKERIYNIGTTRRFINSSSSTRQGNIILSGNFAEHPYYRHSFLLVKPNTDTVFIRNGSLLITGDNAIKQTPDNGLIFFGTIQQGSAPNNFADANLQKFNSNGLPKWSRVYNYSDYDIAQALLIASDSGYFLAGMGSVNGKHSRYYLSRTDSIGNLKWQKDYTWSSNDYVMDMKYNRHGEIIMAGNTSFPVPPINSLHIKLMVVNQNGDSIRGSSLTVTNQNRRENMLFNFNSVTTLSDGGYLVTANIDTANIGTNYLGMVVKTNGNLQPVWHYIKRQNPEKQHIFTKAKELADGSVLALAFENSQNSNKFFLYRFSSAGTLLNTYTFTSSFATMVRAVTLDALPDTTFMIGGEATVTPFPNYTSGFYVAKVRIAGLPQVLSLKPDMPATVANATLGLAYPNPTTASSIIPYTLPKNYSKASILLREIATGREVRRYELNRGHSSLIVNLCNLSNGLYLYSLVVDEKPVATRKLAVMK